MCPKKEKRLLLEAFCVQMGRPTGLEPASVGATIRCVNQLRHDRHTLCAPFNFNLKDGACKD